MADTGAEDTSLASDILSDFDRLDERYPNKKESQPDSVHTGSEDHHRSKVSCVASEILNFEKRLDERHDPKGSCSFDHRSQGRDPILTKQDSKVAKFMNPKIYMAAQTGDEKGLSQELENDTECSLLEQESPQGNTVLHIAVRSGHDQILEMILRKSQDLIIIKKKNEMGDLPIHVAASNGHFSTVKFLVQFVEKEFPKNDERSKQLIIFMLEAKNNKGDTALHIALRNRDKEMAEFLAKANPGVSHSLDEDEKTFPLYMAAEYGYLEVVKSLMQNPADAKTRAEEFEAKFIAFATLNGRNKAVLDKIMGEHSTLLHSKDNKGRTPLSHAAFIGDLEGVQYFLKRCTVHVYEKDEKGYYPIHLASSRGHVDIIKLFLQECPDSIELLNSERQNLLHVAAKSGKANVVAYILKTPQCKNVLNERDVSGNTPLHLATMHWHPKIVRALTSDKRICLNLVNNENRTALDVADIMRTMDTVCFREHLTRVALLSAGASRSRLPRTRPNGESSVTSKSPDLGKYKDRADTLLLVSTLVATVTFAAGFTMPGGNNGSEPHQGKAIFVKSPMFAMFMLCNTMAMYSSIIVAITLIWAQIGDLNLIGRAFNWALPLLGIALSMMSLAFMAGAYLVVSEVTWLAIAVLIIDSIFIATAWAIFVPLCNLPTCKGPISRLIWCYSFNFMLWASRCGDDDDETTEEATG